MTTCEVEDYVYAVTSTPTNVTHSLYVMDAIVCRWLKENEGTGLTEANVLDYFALSEWYDKTCLTGQWMQAKQHIAMAVPGKPDILKCMEGIDYQVSHALSPCPANSSMCLSPCALLSGVPGDGYP
jgi:hypothetical protein